MKKILIMLLLAVMSLNVGAQSFVVKDNVYTTTSFKKKVEGKKTPYQYESRDGQKYDIYILDDGRCYTNRVSGTTGKPYRAYLKEEISRDIAKKCNIQYTYIKKSKKKS